MVRCWDIEPGRRPSFSELSTSISRFITDMQRAADERRRRHHHSSSSDAAAGPRASSPSPSSYVNVEDVGSAVTTPVVEDYLQPHDELRVAPVVDISTAYQGRRDGGEGVEQVEESGLRLLEMTINDDGELTAAAVAVEYSSSNKGDDRLAATAAGRTAVDEHDGYDVRNSRRVVEHIEMDCLNSGLTEQPADGDTA